MKKHRNTYTNRYIENEHRVKLGMKSVFEA